LNQVVEIISTIRSQFSCDIQLPDWNQLVKLPSQYSREDVWDLFYPGLQPGSVPQPSSHRQRDFLSTIDEGTYYKLCHFLGSEPAYCFLDIQALLKTTKQEGKLMSTVISHVCQWLNKEPTKVADRDNNKPLLRKDLVPGLLQKYGAEAEGKSIVLQQLLLDYVRDHTKDFTSTTIDHYLHEFADTAEEKYAVRFEHNGWQNLLSLVLDFAGPHLQHPCMVRFNSEGPRTTSPMPSSTTAQIAEGLVRHIPEHTQNPALQTARAAESLCNKIQPVIAQWVSEQCVEALERHGDHWQDSTIRVVQEERKNSELFLEQLRSPLSPPPGRQRSLSHHEWGDAGHSSFAHEPAESSITTKQAPNSAPRVLPSVTSLTAAQLHDRRAAYRTQRTAQQQESLVHFPSAESSVAQRTDDQSLTGAEPHCARTITGSKHWRRKVAVTQR
jgi:hypothetical protein